MSQIRTLGIIPARGGSKGVARKNIRSVADEPLIAYAIRAAQESSSLTAYLTTTDDHEIASVAESYDCPVLRRPDGLATDDSPIVPTLVHALEYSERHGDHFDAVVLLQPTAPIRTGQNIDDVIDMLAQDSAVDSVVSVCAVEDAHPGRMYRLRDESWIEPLWADWERALRQELPSVYHRNGALYACRRDLLFDHGMIVGERKKAYVMPRELFVNIDDEKDLMTADLLVRLWKKERL